jgi:Ca2+/Na+ antiporter
MMPQVRPAEVGKHSLRDYAVRFAFGACISLLAGVVGLKFGARAGGVFLGFPAILPASLTLIQKRAGKTEAAIDSEGAVLGAVAFATFATFIFVMVEHLGVIATLLVGLALWLLVAIALYVAVMKTLDHEPVPR